MGGVTRALDANGLSRVDLTGGGLLDALTHVPMLKPEWLLPC